METPQDRVAALLEKIRLHSGDSTVDGDGVEDANLFVGASNKSAASIQKAKDALVEKLLTHGWIMFLPLSSVEMTQIRDEITALTHLESSAPDHPVHSYVWSPKLREAARKAYMFCNACAEFVHMVPNLPFASRSDKKLQYFSELINFVDADPKFGNPLEKTFNTTFQNGEVATAPFFPTLVGGPFAIEVNGNYETWRTTPTEVPDVVDPLRGFAHDVFSAMGWFFNHIIDDKTTGELVRDAVKQFTATESTPFIYMNFGTLTKFHLNPSDENSPLGKMHSRQRVLLDSLADQSFIPRTIIGATDEIKQISFIRDILIGKVCFLRAYYLNLVMLWARPLPDHSLNTHIIFKNMFSKIEKLVPTPMRHLEILVSFAPKGKTRKRRAENFGGESVDFNSTYIHHASAPIIVMVGVVILSMNVAFDISWGLTETLDALFSGIDAVVDPPPETLPPNTSSILGPRGHLGGTFTPGEVVLSFDPTTKETSISLTDDNTLVNISGLLPAKDFELLSHPVFNRQVNVVSQRIVSEDGSLVNISSRNPAIEPPLLDTWEGFVATLLTNYVDQRATEKVDLFRLKTASLIPVLHLIALDQAIARHSWGSPIPSLEGLADIPTLWSDTPLCDCFTVFTELPSESLNLTLYSNLSKRYTKPYKSQELGLDSYVAVSSTEEFPSEEMTVNQRLLENYLVSYAALKDPEIWQTFSNYCKTSFAKPLTDDNLLPSGLNDLRWVVPRIIVETVKAVDNEKPLPNVNVALMNHNTLSDGFIEPWDLLGLFINQIIYRNNQAIAEEIENAHGIMGPIIFKYKNKKVNLLESKRKPEPLLHMNTSQIPNNVVVYHYDPVEPIVEEMQATDQETTSSIQPEVEFKTEHHFETETNTFKWYSSLFTPPAFDWGNRIFLEQTLTLVDISPETFVHTITRDGREGEVRVEEIISKRVPGYQGHLIETSSAYFSMFDTARVGIVFST